ncbi:hypothetical protein BJ875DRAFT_481417 [Amylocarpus encephaloides]|uniref:Uncharacterized protein n=1 Tax=Amylocarpus encephaloides TaxID=45428 RepID=A0A9P8C814_9HELO|nr:hypothetical protein BJ875DRAFT_481417 [Amylocarpus encephaloides]
MAHIYIIYNADSTAMGKIKYACTKIMSSASDSPCSACDLTHNGLHLNETAEWSVAKKRIGGAEVQQLHRDELSVELKQFIDLEKVKLPVVLGKESMEGTLKVLMTKEELGLCSKDHEKFLASLQKNASAQSIALDVQSKI